MYKRLIYLLLGLTLAATTSTLGQSITFTFANRTITGTSPKFLEFDVLVAGGTGGTKLGDTQVYINYNTSGFGSSIQANGKITVTKGTHISGASYTNSPQPTPQVLDNTSSRVSIQVSYTGGAGNGASLPTSPTQLLHVKIEISNQAQTAGLSFAQSLMAGQQYQDDNSTVYSPVTASDTDDGALPVELSSFSANVNSNNVSLNWKTATEVDNNGFEVQRAVKDRKSGIGSWEKIGFVEGYGNSNSPKEYSFTDKNLTGGTNFAYRLKQIDNDGKYKYSKEVEVEVVPKEYSLYQNYPNPFNPVTEIKYNLPEAAKVILKVYNIIGQEVAILVNGIEEAGYHSVKFEGSNLPSGTYIYRMQTGSFVQTKKMVLLK